MKPICSVCTRAARTADTPSVKVRVEKALVLRDGDALLLVVRCHGEREETDLDAPGNWTEDDLGRLEVFRG